MAGEYLADLQENERLWRSKIGSYRYEALERFTRERTQEPLLGRGNLTPIDLAMMFNLPGRRLAFDSSRMWDDAFASSLCHIRLTELPQSDGQSAGWKKEISAKVEEFRTRWAHLLDPLLIPVAVQVVVRPPPPTSGMLIRWLAPHPNCEQARS